MCYSQLSTSPHTSLPHRQGPLLRPHFGALGARFHGQFDATRARLSLSECHAKAYDKSLGSNSDRRRPYFLRRRRRGGAERCRGTLCPMTRAIVLQLVGGSLRGSRRVRATHHTGQDRRTIPTRGTWTRARSSALAVCSVSLAFRRASPVSQHIRRNPRWEKHVSWLALEKRGSVESFAGRNGLELCSKPSATVALLPPIPCWRHKKLPHAAQLSWADSSSSTKNEGPSTERNKRH